MDIIESVLELPKQCRQARDEVANMELPSDWNLKVKNIVVCGMGGSALGAHVVQSIVPLNIPLFINNSYNLPDWANYETLFILSSYSGNTEEVLACAEQCFKRSQYVAGITTGGKLAQILKEKSKPVYVFDPKYNDTSQPRMGVGYSFMGLASLISGLRLDQDYSDSVSEGFEEIESIKIDKVKDQAKEYAKKIKGKLPIIFAEDYLTGHAHIFANQLNETSKTISTYFTIPEANHHLFEGLKHPELPYIAIFLGAYGPNGFYSDRLEKRFKITQEILEKNGCEVLWYKPQLKGFGQVFEIILFSSLVTAYLAQEYGEDPLSIPTVDYFKEKLG